MRPTARWSILGLALIITAGLISWLNNPTVPQRSSARTAKKAPATSAPVRSAATTQAYHYLIKAGQRIDSVSPRPGEWVRISAGTYGAFTFPASGELQKPIHYVFDAGAVVDAAGAPRVVDRGNSQYLDIDGLVARGARNLIQSPAVLIGKGTVLRNSLIERNDGPGLGFGDDSQAINVIMQYNGQCGFLSAGNRNVLMKDCKIIHNNHGLADPAWKDQVLGGWEIKKLKKGLWYVNPFFEAGGGKFSNSTGAVVDGLESAWNIGGALSFDINNKDATIRNCYFHDGIGLDTLDSSTWQSGQLSIELAGEGSAVVENNRFSNVGGPGLTLIAVHNIIVRGNDFVGGMGIMFRNDDARGDIANVTITGNRFENARIECWGNKFPLRDVKIDGNSFVSGSTPLFRWDGKDFNDLPAVRDALGFERSGRMVD